VNTASVSTEIATQTEAPTMSSQAPAAPPRSSRGRWIKAVRMVFEHRELVVVAATSVVFLVAIAPGIWNLPKVRDLQKENDRLIKENDDLRKANDNLINQMHWMRGASTVLQRLADREDSGQLSNTAAPRLTYLQPLDDAGLGNIVRREIAIAKRTTLPFPLTR